MPIAHGGRFGLSMPGMGAMVEFLTAKSFQQALIPNDLQIIGKVLKGIYTPC
jgi:hypothetical protein